MNNKLKKLYINEKLLTSKVEALKEGKIKRTLLPLRTGKTDERSIIATLAQLTFATSASVTTLLAAQGITDTSIFKSDQFIVAGSLTIYAAAIAIMNTLQAYDQDKQELSKMKKELKLIKKQESFWSKVDNMPPTQKKETLLKIRNGLDNIKHQPINKKLKMKI